MSVRNSELFRAMKTIATREINGESVPVGWEEWTDEEIVFLAANPAGLSYVNIYQLDRVCGGPEEGGWWFDTGTVELSIVCDSEESAQERAEMLREVFENHGNRYSVIYYRKPSDYDVDIDDKPGADWPVESPRYE